MEIYLPERIAHQKSFILILITIIVFCVAVACFAGEVTFIKVRGETIGIGDTADQVFAVLKNDDMVNQTVEKDPNNPNSLLVSKDYEIKGRKFSRVEDGSGSL